MNTGGEIETVMQWIRCPELPVQSLAGQRSHRADTGTEGAITIATEQAEAVKEVSVQEGKVTHCFQSKR